MSANDERLDEGADQRRDCLVDLRGVHIEASELLTALGAALDAPGPVGDVDDLCAVMWSLTPAAICLVIDDAHRFDDTAVELLGQLYTSMPNNAHLVVAGRRMVLEPPMRDRLDGAVDVLVEDDLGFDDDELERFAVANELDLDRLPDRRWPALLALEVATGHAGAVQYLVEEVLEAIDEPLRADLRALAVPRPLDAELIAALTDERVNAAMIVEVLPMTAQQGDVVAIHDLVRDALLDGSDAASLADANLRAAGVLQARGMLLEAIDHFVAAAAHESLDEIARDLARGLFVRDATATNRRVVDRLRAALGSSLALDAIDGALSLLDRPDMARGQLEAAQDRARREGDAELEVLCTLRLIEEAYTAADLERVRRGIDELDTLANGDAPHSVRVQHLARLWAHSLAGEHRAAYELASDVYATTPSDDYDLRDLARFYSVIHRGYAGEVRVALDDAAAVRQLPDSLYANRLAGFELIQRWHLGELDAEGRALATRLVERIGAMGQTHLFVEGAATTALFHASAGDVGTAERLTARAEVAAVDLPSTAWPHHTVAQARAALQVMDGDEGAATRTLIDAMPPDSVAGVPRFVYGATATLSYVLVPEARAVWEREPCGPDHELRRDIGRALVAWRECGDGRPAERLPWSRPARLRPWAFEPHLVELAVAAVEAGSTRAGGVLSDLRQDPRRHLQALVSGSTELREETVALLRAAPRRPAEVTEVRVLGPFELVRGDRLVADDQWRRQRVRDLLALLVDRRSEDRIELSELMWPGKSPAAAASNLRYTLNQLLAALEPDRDDAARSWFVRADGARLELAASDRLTVDVDRFRHLLASAQFDDAAGSPASALEHYLAAIDTYRGPYLDGVSDPEWGHISRLRLQGEFVTAASRSVDLLRAHGDLDEAERIAGRAVDAEALNEDASRALAHVLLERGRVSAARDVIGHLLAGLAEVELAPDADTTALAARLNAL
ncbi:MAG: BTAD domain-containing putative transcriptional regulator [Actinomycetota bacterium]